MNSRQELFCEEYLKDLNATQSAIRAGYSPKTAYSQGQRLLKNVEIQKKINEVREIVKTNNVATIRDIEEFLSESIRGEIEEEVVLTLGTGDGTSEIAKTTKQISAKDRIKAAELLGKRYKLFTDKQEIEHTGAVQFVDDIEDDFDDTD